MISAIKKTSTRFHTENGAVLVIVAFLAVVFLAFSALAIDIAHLYVVKNELQNAADAGALAGARCLYDCMVGEIPGSKVNVNANQIAKNAAMANKSEKVAVEVYDNDVQRGHWSFTTRTFTANENTLTPPILWGGIRRGIRRRSKFYKCSQSSGSKTEYQS